MATEIQPRLASPEHGPQPLREGGGGDPANPRSASQPIDRPANRHHRTWLENRWVPLRSSSYGFTSKPSALCPHLLECMSVEKWGVEAPEPLCANSTAGLLVHPRLFPEPVPAKAKKGFWEWCGCEEML